jgi:hypothetical protein
MQVAEHKKKKQFSFLSHALVRAVKVFIKCNRHVRIRLSLHQADYVFSGTSVHLTGMLIDAMLNCACVCVHADNTHTHAHTCKQILVC